ncbi:MAG: Poly(A) polymerase [Pseudomonadota bacterium]|jgi:poly(A) polymerase
MKFKIEISPNLFRILSIIRDAGGTPRLVGGCVRDALLGVSSVSDIDINSTLLPEELMALCSAQQIKFYDTGSRYGTVTVNDGDRDYEVTTLRKDTNCDGRHTKPEFTDNFELDAKRRDFTINSMSYCPFEEKLFDYCGGYQDLLDKRLVFIGNPDERIKEDHLRILRFFRFSDRFAEMLDPQSLRACIKNKELLSRLSKERILSELNKILISKTSHKALDIMIKYEILSSVLDIKLHTELLKKINLEAPEILEPNVQVKCAALFIRNSLAQIIQTMKELHFSRNNSAAIKELCAFYKSNHDIENMTHDELKKIFYPLWIEGVNMMQYLVISCAWKNNFFDDLKVLLSNPPKCPINGNHPDLVGLNGAEIKSKLQELKLEWIKNNF